MARKKVNDSEKSYLILVAEGSSYYIPNAFHPERNDSLMKVKDDEEACKAAEKDGIKLIYGMKDVPDGVYVDTKENRKVILEMLKKYAEYKTK